MRHIMRLSIAVAAMTAPLAAQAADLCTISTTKIRGGVMRKLLLGSVAFAALVAGPAVAANLRAPVYRAPPVVVAYSWTGWYLGGNVGYSWGKSTNAFNFYAPIINSNGLCPGDFCAAGSDSSKLNGAIGGIQTGYNWQTGNFLLGVETDIQLSGQKGSNLLTSTFPTGATSNGAAPIIGQVVTDHTKKLLWFGTLRGRAGITFDRLLIYGTGGLAYGRVRSEGAAVATGTALTGPAILADCFPNGCPFLPLGSWSNTRTKAGWTAGVGIEGAITDNWSMRLEYLYIDLGSVDTVFATSAGCFGSVLTGTAACNTVGTGAGTAHSSVTDNIVRLGLNYKFGYAPVITK